MNYVALLAGLEREFSCTMQAIAKIDRPSTADLGDLQSKLEPTNNVNFDSLDFRLTAFNKTFDSGFQLSSPFVSDAFVVSVLWPVWLDKRAPVTITAHFGVNSKTCQVHRILTY